MYKVDNGAEYPDRRSAFVPVLCQQCGNDTPCVAVCPQQAVDVDPATGIVGQMPRALPGLPLLHGGLPVSRPLLQLVGSGVARRHGEDAEPRRGAAHARRGGEVQLLPRPLARRQGQGRGRRQARNRRRRITCRPAWRPAPPAPSASATSTIRPAEAAQAAREREQLPPARKARHRAQDLLPLQARLGARDRQRAAARHRKGERRG